MFFHQRFIPGLAIYSYMVGDERTGECAVIDPVRDVDSFIECARANGLHIRHILETHVHADFVSGARELKARLDDEPTIHCSGMGGEEWTPPYADFVASPGHDVRMGNVRLVVVHTPGHTPEHVSWALFDGSRSKDTPWLVFTGDFVFVGDVGRPDLLGEKARVQLAQDLYKSVFEVLPGYADFTEIFPAHGAGSLCGKAIGSRSSSTLGYERKFNTSLQKEESQVWIDRLLGGMPIAPPYFARMKRINAHGPELIGPVLPGRRRFSASEVNERVCEHCLILDVRAKEAFAASHIPGAINIPLGAALPTWAGWVLPYDHPTLIVLDDPDDMPEIVTHLLRVGFDDVRGYLESGMDAWENGGFPIGQLETIPVHELGQSQNDDRYVLDVRTQNEFVAGHVPGAHHVHGGLLQDEIDKIPADREIAVMCGSGYRAAVASSFLKREGFERVSNVLGGMSAYTAAGFPVERG